MGHKTVFRDASALAFAVHSLFDAQVGPSTGLFEVPVLPETIHGDRLYDPMYEPYDRFTYHKLVVVGDNESDAVSQLWPDFKFLWQVTSRRASLYWRYPSRIAIERKAFNVIARTRISIPDEAFIGHHNIYGCPHYHPEGCGGFYP